MKYIIINDRQALLSNYSSLGLCRYNIIIKYVIINEIQLALLSNYNSLGRGVHHQWSVSTVPQWSYLRTLDIPGYHTTTDTNGQ